jgi:hypothetical protein
MAEFSKHATMPHHQHVLDIGSLLRAPEFSLFLTQITAGHSRFLFISNPNHSSLLHLRFLCRSSAPAQRPVRPPARSPPVTCGFKANLNTHSMCVHESSLHTYGIENGYRITNVIIQYIYC